MAMESRRSSGTALATSAANCGLSYVNSGAGTVYGNDTGKLASSSRTGSALTVGPGGRKNKRGRHSHNAKDTFPNTCMTDLSSARRQHPLTLTNAVLCECGPRRCRWQAHDTTAGQSVQEHLAKHTHTAVPARVANDKHWDVQRCNLQCGESHAVRAIQSPIHTP